MFRFVATLVLPIVLTCCSSSKNNDGGNFSPEPEDQEKLSGLNPGPVDEPQDDRDDSRPQEDDDEIHSESDSNNGEPEEEGEDVTAGFKTGEGANWESDCYVVGELFRRDVFRTNGTEISKSTNIFSDKLCVVLQYQIIEKSNLEMLERYPSRGVDFHVLTRKVENLSINPARGEVAQRFNELGFCGLDSWSSFQETSIVGLDCEGLLLVDENDYIFSAFEYRGELEAVRLSKDFKSYPENLNDIFFSDNRLNPTHLQD